MAVLKGRNSPSEEWQRITSVAINASFGQTSYEDATAVSANILDGMTAYIADGKTTGTMTDNAAVELDLSAKTQEVVIPQGYHNGSGVVSISAAEQAKIISGNIKSGVTLLGVTGSGSVKDTSDATATAGEILAGESAYVNGTKIIGTMTDRGSVTQTISQKAQQSVISQGYHNGSGVVSISAAEQAKIISGNIKSGVTLLGVEGSSAVVDTSSGTAVAGDIKSGVKAFVDGSEVTGTFAAETKTVSPTTSAQTVMPSSGKYLASVTVSGVDSSIDSNIIPGNIKDGASILGVEGTYIGDGIDTSDATAAAGDIKLNQTAYVNGEKLTGTFAAETKTVSPTTSAQTITPSSGKYLSQVSVSAVNAEALNVSLSKDDAQVYAPSSGSYYNSVYVPRVTSSIDSNIVASNIKSGVSILGVAGSYQGITSQASVTPMVVYNNSCTISGLSFIPAAVYISFAIADSNGLPTQGYFEWLYTNLYKAVPAFSSRLVNSSQQYIITGNTTGTFNRGSGWLTTPIMSGYSSLPVYIQRWVVFSSL